MGRTTCTEPQCLYMGALYLTGELYLYSPYGPYGLYRASVLVHGCTLPYRRAIPLLPLRAVRPVQSLSACTWVHFTLQESYTSTPPMGRTACAEPQCLYKGALYKFLHVSTPTRHPQAALTRCLLLYINVFTKSLFVCTTTHCSLKAYCAIWVRRSNFRHQASPRVSPRESTQRRKAELWAKNVR